MAIGKDNFILEAWISEAVEALQSNGGRSFTSSQVVEALIKNYGGQRSWQSVTALLPYASEIKSELEKRDFSLRAGKWTKAQQAAAKSKPAPARK